MCERAAESGRSPRPFLARSSASRRAHAFLLPRCGAGPDADAAGDRRRRSRADEDRRGLSGADGVISRRPSGPAPHRGSKSVELVVEALDPREEMVEEIDRFSLPARTSSAMLPRRRVPTPRHSVPVRLRFSSSPECVFDSAANTSRSPAASRSAQRPKCRVPSYDRIPTTIVGLREGNDRERLDQPGAHHVERLLRTGNVGDDQSSRTLTVNRGAPRGSSTSARRSHHVQQEVGAQRLPLLLEVGGLGGDLAQAVGRLGVPTAATRRSPRPCCERAPLICRSAPTPDRARATADRRCRLHAT